MRARLATPRTTRVAPASRGDVARAPRRAPVARAAPGDVNKRQEDLGGLGGDIGARDPTAGELGSNFGTSTLGHADTDHILQVPTAMAEMIMLKNKKCQPGAQAEKLDFQGQEVLRKQVWDWKIRPGRGNFECLRRELATAEGEAGRLCELIAATATAEGWAPATCEATSGSKVLVELGSDAIKGVCTNDFILAAKIDMNEEAMGMLVKEAPKARNWF